MKIQEKWFKRSLFFSSAILCFLLLNSSDVNAAGYTSMPITGTRNINLTFSANDKVSGIPYSGNLRYQACNDCEGNPNGAWTQLKYASNDQTIDSAVQEGTFGIKNWTLPDVEGEHTVCVRVMDNAIHGQSNDTGNISAQQCNKVFYDKTAPIISDVVINNGNDYANHGEIPITFKVTDNRAGILSGIETNNSNGSGKITYNNGYGGLGTISADEITCVNSDNPVEGDGSETCTVNATLHLNSDIDYIDLTFTLYDNVNNSASYSRDEDNMPYRIYFDKVAPTIDLKVPMGQGGTINTNAAIVEYHVKDDIESPWLHASGIQKVVLSNSNGANQKTILVNTDFTQDMDTTLDGIVRDYILENCPNGAVKMEAWDRAGNKSEEIFDNNGQGISCQTFEISNVIVEDVVNPTLYNISQPFTALEYMPDGKIDPLPYGLAGANMTFSLNYSWDGDEDNTMYGKYVITVKDEKGTYNKSFTGNITEDEFTKIGDGLYATKHTITLPTDAPASTSDNKVYVYIQTEAYVQTVEGDVIRTGGDTFPDIGTGAIAQIVGSIEDYLWFSEIN